MKKTFFLLGVVLLVFTLSACGDKEEDKVSSSSQSNPSDEQTKTITYLGNSYTVPVKSEKIIFLNAFELIEDAVVLEVEPFAASAIGSDEEPFPSFFRDITANTIPLLGTSDESLEYILDLAPDLIISTDMETPAVLTQLEKIAPVIPTSHYGPDWQSNLELLAEITGKTDMAKGIIDKYNQDKQEAIDYLSSFKEKDVIAIRIRGGEMMVYPKDVFLNDVLYGELGLTVPEIIKNTTEQTVLSLEGLYAANPDYIFVQYDSYENADKENILEDLEKSEVWKGLNAVKNNQVFVNAVDPLVMGGGTVNGRIRILEAAMETLK
ncbi:ABC transporter substrate-binding protein [Sporosarcina sp. ACRSM]|uniref:ABC transporter substrate-binding protein n=1 Tax=Sporosarcina sp. ACRSM TaxID=2918216 RepID=UPI001EF48531|nr:ABC transporter substrate-binding protein [Sporosarcina sp. ACRSM]MCG7337193.1 ABC transporter substrate-binding protein [Sporosarcina sp. ACRSM]